MVRSTLFLKICLSFHQGFDNLIGSVCIYALVDFDRYKEAAKRPARIQDGVKHNIYSQLPDFSWYEPTNCVEMHQREV